MPWNDTKTVVTVVITSIGIIVTVILFSFGNLHAAHADVVRKQEHIEHRVDVLESEWATIDTKLDFIIEDVGEIRDGMEEAHD